jgi:alpha-beta hydrolase superfamily lysophospholipase
VTKKAKIGFIRFISALLILYLLGGFILYFIQDLILFHPTPLSIHHQYTIRQSYTEHNLGQADGTNLALIKFLTPQKRGIVLYFHGNMQNVERYAPFSTFFTDQGYELWMMDYRGFGKSTGTITEKGLYADALQVYNLATNEISTDSIIIYGKSLGTGIATQLASTQKSKKLILETPYYAIPRIAKDKFPIYPTNLLLKYNIPTHQFLPKVTVPVTAFHGTEDEVISYSQVQRLKEENPRLELLTVQEGKHNNLLRFSIVKTRLNQLLD